MQGFFPRRSRQELKKKFYREEKVHPELVKATISGKTMLPLDLTLFEACLGKIDNNPSTAVVNSSMSSRYLGQGGEETATEESIMDYGEDVVIV